MLENAARQFPNSPALLSSDGTKISYKEYFERACQVAETLNREFPVASKICLLCKKSVASLVVIQGILRSGACYIPLQADKSFEEILIFFQNSTFDLLITTDTFITTSTDDKTEPAVGISVLDQTFLLFFECLIFWTLNQSLFYNQLCHL